MWDFAIIKLEFKLNQVDVFRFIKRRSHWYFNQISFWSYKNRKYKNHSYGTKPFADNYVPIMRQ